MQVANALTPALWVAVAACPLAVHAALGAVHWAPAATILAAYQVAAVGLVLLRRTRAGQAAWLLLAVPAFLLASYRWGQSSALAVSGISHALVYGGLLALFAGTLRPGRTDLVTAMARRLRPATAPAMAGYTRAVTVAWCAFFAMQLAASLLLLLLAPAPVWSLFVNVLQLPLVAVAFAVELAVRHLRFRSFDHVGIAETVRAFRRHDAIGRAQP